jgi:TPR repeat protein
MSRYVAVIVFACMMMIHAHGVELTPAEKYEQGMAFILLSTSSTEQLQGVELLRSAASQGYGPAQTAMGTLLENGILLMPDAHQAVDWYKKSADQGDWIAQFSLGRLYLGGAISRDTTEAKKWLALAAKAGSSGAAYYMGLLHDENQNVGPDFPTARKWYLQAAQLGNPFAQQRLAELLANGMGGERDRQQAYMWLLVSLELGNETAAALLPSLEFDIGQNGRDAARTQALGVIDKVLENRRAGCHGWKTEFLASPLPPSLARQQICERSL